MSFIVKKISAKYANLYKRFEKVVRGEPKPSISWSQNSKSGLLGWPQVGLFPAAELIRL